MNISRIDLNLLVYLDVLLQERNVSRAAERLGITQPAMSNSLKRLRDLFGDPLLIRTGSGMKPTERALDLESQVRDILASTEQVMRPAAAFDPQTSRRVFRIMASDYAESTLLPAVLGKLRDEAPFITLDILTPSDVTFQDVEKGKVDLAVNRFDYLPQSFHQLPVWRDGFGCLMHRDNPALEDFTLDNYLAMPHIWVSKTGAGIGTGMNPKSSQKLGWVDDALSEINKKRRIRVFTRHYLVASLLAEQPDLIATVPYRFAQLFADTPKLELRKPPFPIVPIELKLAWSPLLQHNNAHRWLRQLVIEAAREET